MQQLFFSEVLPQHRSMATVGMTVWLTDPPPSLTSMQYAMECILQEITAVGSSLEGLDSGISALMTKTKSICLDNAGFQNCVTDLEHRVTTVESRLTEVPETRNFPFYAAR
ncbi:hypothetical protein NDU88_005335 [Pleurodeles waltl]|uniref:Uncharacterized protein n=1 Tax=Pleurodeles waltl TaxID=8319 RepID=A0AAV7NM67_PLEWA|nr:hypothetical protein NDU88_005335 [Pleurodeles waltl]